MVECVADVNIALTVLYSEHDTIERYELVVIHVQGELLHFDVTFICQTNPLEGVLDLSAASWILQAKLQANKICDPF